MFYPFRVSHDCWINLAQASKIVTATDSEGDPCLIIHLNDGEQVEYELSGERAKPLAVLLGSSLTPSEFEAIVG